MENIHFLKLCLSPYLIFLRRSWALSHPVSGRRMFSPDSSGMLLYTCWWDSVLLVLREITFALYIIPDVVQLHDSCESM